MSPAPLVTTTHRLVEQPAGLLAGAPQDGWLVVRCAPSAEQATGARLAQVGAPHLTILSTTQRHYSRSRSRRTERAFLPGHWFAHWPAGHHDLYDRLRPGTLSILPVPAGSAFITELRNFVRVVVAGGSLAEPSPTIGDRVEVVHGTLAGCQGRVVAQGAGWSLRVELTLLGTVVTTAIDPGCVQRLD